MGKEGGEREGVRREVGEGRGGGKRGEERGKVGKRGGRGKGEGEENSQWREREMVGGDRSISFSRIHLRNMVLTSFNWGKLGCHFISNALEGRSASAMGNPLLVLPDDDRQLLLRECDAEPLACSVEQVRREEFSLNNHHLPHFIFPPPSFFYWSFF